MEMKTDKLIALINFPGNEDRCSDCSSGFSLRWGQIS